MSISACGCTDVEIVGHRCEDIHCITRTNYRDFILDVFDNTDPCVTASIDADTIDFFIDLAISEFSDFDLVFLRAYQSVTFAVMSCYSRQFDTLERFGESHSKTEGDAKMDGFRQAQHDLISSVSDIQAMTARYNDYSRAAMDASATRTGCSHSDSYGIAIMDDSGEGSKRSRTRKRSILKARHDAQQHNGFDNLSTDAGKSEGYDYSHSYESTEEDHTYAFIISVTEIAKAAHDTRAMDNTSSTQGETTNSSQDWAIANTNRISVDGLRKDSCGQFKSNVNSTTKDQGKADSSNIYTAERTQKQRAEGSGFQRGTQTGRNAHVGEGNDLQHKESDARKSNVSWRFSTIKSYKRSQKYDTLKRLYDVLNDQIQERFVQINVMCGSIADSPSLQPFTESANCRNSSVTINQLLWKFPCLNCFGVL